MCSSKLFGPVIVYPTDSSSQTKPINSKSCYKIPFESTCTVIISRRVRNKNYWMFYIPGIVFGVSRQRLVSQLVGWCFEPSQPQRITSGLVGWCFEPSQPQRITSGLVSWLVGALSQVNHRGLHQGQLVGALSPVNHRGLHQGQLVGALSPVNHRGLHQGQLLSLIHI